MRTFSLRKLFKLAATLALVMTALQVNCLSSRANDVSNAPFQENSWTALKTDYGILFMWNRPGMSFTLAIKGNEIRPMDAGDNIFFIVDGLTVQIQSLPVSNFAPEAMKNKFDDKSILIAHRNWETKFIEEELLHKKISVASSTEKLPNGTDVLVWQYELPEGFKNPDAQKQMYVSVVARNYLILLNGVVSSKDSDAAVRRFLLDKMNTLKVSRDPIDFKKAQEAIRAGREP